MEGKVSFQQLARNGQPGRFRSNAQNSARIAAAQAQGSEYYTVDGFAMASRRTGQLQGGVKASNAQERLRLLESKAQQHADNIATLQADATAAAEERVTARNLAELRTARQARLLREQQAELARQQAELARQQAELARQQAELARQLDELSFTVARNQALGQR
eukprot:152198_1